MARRCFYRYDDDEGFEANQQTQMSYNESNTRQVS